MAAAGPLVTLAVSCCLHRARRLLGERPALLRGRHQHGAGGTAPAVVWLGWVASLNVLVLVVNLLPAFPLDGAQIVHALLWQRSGDRNRATRVVGRMGQGFGVLLGAGGIGCCSRSAPSAA